MRSARETWRSLKQQAPGAYDYSTRIRNLNQQIRRLESLALMMDSNSTPASAESRASPAFVKSSPGDLPIAVRVESRPPADTPTSSTQQLAPVAVRSDTSPSVEPPPALEPVTLPEPGRESPGGQSEEGILEKTFFEEDGILDAELPANSELTVSGREFIKMNFTSTEYPNNPERESTSDVEVEERLKLKVRGSVADDLLEVHIDFDDSLPKVEQQQTRVLYNGRTRDWGFAEFKAAGKFGDVNLSLPSTRFVSYNKEVFGVSGQAHLRNLNLVGGIGPERISVYGIASQSKGRTQKKVFKGLKRRRIPDPVADIQPIRRTYYQPLADTPASARGSILPVRVDSERILLDDRIEGNNDANTLTDRVVTNGPASYRGDFEVLEPGEDYTINYQTGVVRFSRPIRNNYVVAVDLTLANGQRIRDFMIKDPEESDRFDRYHLLNRYPLASPNIVRNDPDRVLEIRDPNNSTRASNTQTYAEVLGMDKNDDGVIDEEFIDFERGVLRFPDTRPFVSPALGAVADTNPTVYGPPATRQPVYEIYQEVLVRENTYTLGVNVIRNSEKVLVDGVRMERGEDYTIDYQTGFLTFFDHVEIDDDTRIEVNFETLSTAAQRDSTFVGGRLEAELTENLSLGTTLLSSSESERDRIPQAGRETEATLVQELDVTWSPLRSLQNGLAWFGNPNWANYPWEDQLQLDLQYDQASSNFNPNQEGAALVDDFDRVDQRVRFSRNHLEWSPADPVQMFPGDTGVLDGRSALEFEEVEDVGHDPNTPKQEAQRSMRVTLNRDAGDTWTSFQQVFSENGRDLRDYQFISLWVRWDGNTEAGRLSLDLGETTEDTDRDGVEDTEDADNNDVLNPGEDDGFPSHDFRFGTNNGQLDGEDIDGNGRLDVREQYLHFEDINARPEVRTDTTPGGWVQYKIPLSSNLAELRGDANAFGKNASDTPAGLEEVLRNVSMVRMVYEPPPGATQPSFLLEEMGVVRTRWQSRSDTGNFQLNVVSGAEDSRLPVPNTDRFRDGDSRRIDKGLSFVFQDLERSDSPVSSARLDVPAGNRLNRYRELVVYFNTRNLVGTRPDTGYVRFGSGNQDYFQYSFDLSGPNPAADPRVEPLGNQWFVLRVDLQQFEQDLIQKTLNGADRFEEGGRRIVGNPSLQQVKQYRLGIVGPVGGTGAEQSLLWDLLHLEGVQEESGDARQVTAKVNVREGLLDLRATDRQVDGEFRTIGLVNSSTANQFVAQNEDDQTLRGSIDLSRFIPESWNLGVPLNFRWSDRTTVIPPDRIERVRDEDLGRVQTDQFHWNAGLQTGRSYPDFQFRYHDRDKRVLQRRRDREWTERETRWNLRGQYSTTFDEPLLGLLPVGEELLFRTSAQYGNLEERQQSFGAVDVDTEAREDRSRSVKVSLRSEPWDGMTIRPRFQMSDLERTTSRSSGIVQRDRTFGLRIDLPGFAGFRPSYDMGIRFNEDFDRGDTVTKSIGTSSHSTFEIGTRPRRWWSQLDFFTMHYRYRVSGSARYGDAGNGLGVQQTYRDFYRDLGWLFEGPSLSVSEGDLSLFRNRASKSLNHNLGGAIQFWSWLDTRYNLNSSRSFGQSENSVERTEVNTVSLNNRLRLREISSWFRRSSQNASLALDYQLRQSESAGQNRLSHQPRIRFSTRWSRAWSTNLNLSAEFNRETDGQVRRRSHRWSPSLGFRWLVNEKEGNGIVWFDNRLEINGTISARFTEQTRNGEIREDEREISGVLGGEYNLTKRIKTRFSGEFSRFKDDFRDANNRNSYSFNASVDFRF